MGLGHLRGLSDRFVGILKAGGGLAQKIMAINPGDPGSDRMGVLANQLVEDRQG